MYMYVRHFRQAEGGTEKHMRVGKLQSVFVSFQVLACAPSNIAVDNMVERLGQAKSKVCENVHVAVQ